MRQMKRTLTSILIRCATALCLVSLAVSAPAEENSLDEILSRLLDSEARMDAALEDVTVETELIERRIHGDGSVKEEKRFTKLIYFTRHPDSARRSLVYEQFLDYSKNGEAQNEDELRKEVDEKLKKSKKGRGQDRSKPITDVFLPEYREFYDITLNGVLDTTIEEYTCYHIRVRARDIKEDLKERINADFYIDTVSMRPVYVTFSPAKFSGNLMFKFKELNMKLRFANFGEDIWLPRSFYLNGKAKAGLFFTVRFSVTENFADPLFNNGLPSELFDERIGLRGPQELSDNTE